MNLMFDFYRLYLVDPEIQDRLSKALKKARGDRSQRQFAKYLGVACVTVRSWEECESFPGLKSLEIIASALHFQSVDELLAFLRDGTRLAPARKRVAEDALPIMEEMSKTEVKRLIQIAIDKLAAM